MKTTEEKIAEKRKTLNEINDTLDKSLKLYDITTHEFGQLFAVNSGKVDGKQTLNGIAQLLSKINDMLKTRNEIENEINALLELDEQAGNKDESNSNKFVGPKDVLLTLMAGAKKDNTVQ